MKMTNEGLKEFALEFKNHVEFWGHAGGLDVDKMIALADVTLAALTAEPVKVPEEMSHEDAINFVEEVGALNESDAAYQAWNACRAEGLRLNGTLIREGTIDNTAQQYEALAGWRMVPIEPTDEMLAAYYDKSIAPISRLSVIGYRAMLEAAPKPGDKC